MHAVRLIGGLLAAVALHASPSFAQVRCTMPNGVVITQQLGDCPRDAVRVERLQPAQPVLKADAAKPSGASVATLTAKAQAPASLRDDGNGMSFGAWLIFGMLAAALVWAIRGSVGASGKRLYCTSCGYEGPGKTVTRGSILIEIILWLCFIVPGLIYSIWRQGSKYKACASCGARTLVPPESPVAQAQKRAMAQ